MKTQLTLTEQINRALDEGGRKQTWLISKLNSIGFDFTDSKFSRKKMGYTPFTQEEIQAIETLLSVKLNN